MRCSGTWRITRTERLQDRWDEYTRPVTQLMTLIRVKVVLLMGLRGDPAAGDKHKRGKGRMGRKKKGRNLSCRNLAFVPTQPQHTILHNIPQNNKIK